MLFSSKNVGDHKLCFHSRKNCVMHNIQLQWKNCSYGISLMPNCCLLQNLLRYSWLSDLNITRKNLKMITKTKSLKCVQFALNPSLHPGLLLFTLFHFLLTTYCLTISFDSCIEFSILFDRSSYKNNLTQISHNNTFHFLRYAHFRYAKYLFLKYRGIRISGKVAYFLRKIQTLCVNNSEFLGLRMQNFQSIIFIWARTYRKIFKFALVHL